MGKRKAIIGLGSSILWASTSVAQAQEAPAPAPSATAAPAAHPSTPAQPTAPNPPAQAANPAPAPSAADAEVARLEAELASVLDELIQARTRTAALVKTLFRTPIEVRVVRRADAQRLVHIALRLDGVPVHDSDGSALASGEAQLFSGFAAPGVHELTVEVTEEAKERSAYRYTRVERFRLEVAKETRTQIELLMRDDSDMAEELPEGDEGEYDVRTILRARAEKVSER